MQAVRDSSTYRLPQDDPSSPGSPKASWAPQGLGDRLLDPSSTGTKVSDSSRLPQLSSRAGVR